MLFKINRNEREHASSAICFVFREFSVDNSTGLDYLWDSGLDLRALSGVDKTAKAASSPSLRYDHDWSFDHSSIVICNHEHLVGSQGLIVVKWDLIR